MLRASILYACLLILSVGVPAIIEGAARAVGVSSGNGSDHALAVLRWNLVSYGLLFVCVFLKLAWPAYFGPIDYIRPRV